MNILIGIEETNTVMLKIRIKPSLRQKIDEKLVELNIKNQSALIRQLIEHGIQYASANNGAKPSTGDDYGHNIALQSAIEKSERGETATASVLETDF